MLLKFPGLKIILLSFLVVIACGYSLSLLPHFWQSFQSNFSFIYLGLTLVVVAFSLQFNQSRFTYLAVIWLIHFLMIDQQIARDWLNSHQQWHLLTVASCLCYLSFCRDRGVISWHLFSRITTFIVIGLVIYGFIWLSDWLFANYLSAYLEYKTLSTQYLPLGLIGIAIAFKAIRHAQFVLSAIAVSFCLWLTLNYSNLPLPLTLQLIVLMTYSLLVMILDSYFLAYRDELTTLPSRRALNNLALSLSRRYTVAMLDVDHFKKFNDTYGHDIGDQVLKLVAVKLKNVKAGGKVFRYGGEEFTVVFSRKNSDAVWDELERLRQSIADYKIVIREPQRAGKKARSQSGKVQQKTVSVTISIGVAERESKQKFEQVIKKADQALYRAKKKGRNCVAK